MYVCRHRHGGQVIANTYGPGEGPILMYGPVCTPMQISLAECPHGGWGIHTCTHDDDDAIECTTFLSTTPPFGNCSCNG